MSSGTPSHAVTAAVLAAAVAAVLWPARSARADRSIIDNNKTIAVDCARDPEINLVGNHLTVTATGVCAKITVTGNHESVTGSARVVYVAGGHNTVTLAAADDITVAGSNNTLTVQKALSRAAPRVTNSGRANHVTGPSQ
ncbi:MAG TPA: DUF3060 domain-containing protein [Kofleriaceae bacterium]|nr:DUF3060 domain-containing protein [Kofleriaceae bacterium]